MNQKEWVFFYGLIERVVNETVQRVKNDPKLLSETFVLSRKDKLRIETELEKFVRNR